MKLVNSFATACALAITLVASAAAVTLPDTGTYFILNKQSGEALQPAGSTVGQNVLTYEANKSGMQKWTVTRIIDPVTKKPTNRYTIKLAGENEDLQLHPHDIADACSVLLPGKSTMVLDAKEDGIVIKSVSRNGDALFIYPSPPMQAEARFGPSDGSAKYLWVFDPAN
jgi:hypothetical protein